MCSLPDVHGSVRGPHDAWYSRYEHGPSEVRGSRNVPDLRDVRGLPDVCCTPNVCGSSDVRGHYLRGSHDVDGLKKQSHDLQFHDSRH